MRQTGGLASGETSTKSSSFSSAKLSASAIGKTPNCSPSSSMTRTSGTLISSLMRVVFVAIP